jgi:hypothetical protein
MNMSTVGGTIGLAKKVVGTGVRVATAPLSAVPLPALPFVGQGKQDYFDTLRTLSQASTTGPHFEAFIDVPWDEPEYAIDHQDERWVLPSVDPLSQTDWYRSLPKERQIEVARHRLTAITKTGSQFEQLLLLGGTQFLMGLQNDNPEFRYFMHELTEECHHIQMFQEFTNRSAPQVSGAPQWLFRAIPAVSLLGSLWPTLFFQIILAGEEPIDHVQKNILRTGGVHPLLDKIMAIHAAEEARHIGFAHAWLEHHAPEMTAANRYALGVLTPLVMRLGFQAIMVPSKADAEMMGIPDDVMRDTFTRRNEAFRRLLVEVCADVRAGCEQTGLLTPRTRWAWRKWGVDGRPSRFRAEPAPAVA